MAEPISHAVVLTDRLREGLAASNPLAKWQSSPDDTAQEYSLPFVADSFFGSSSKSPASVQTHELGSEH